MTGQPKVSFFHHEGRVILRMRFENDTAIAAFDVNTAKLMVEQLVTAAELANEWCNEQEEARTK